MGARRRGLSPGLTPRPHHAPGCWNRSPPAARPDRAVWIAVTGHRGGEHLPAPASRQWGAVAAALQAYRGDEMFMEMVDVLDDAILPGPRDGDIVEHRQVLDHLA